MEKRRRNRPEYEMEIIDTTYPGIGVGYVEGQEMHAKHMFPGQVILGRHLKNKQGIGQMMVLDKVKAAPWEVEPKCVHYLKCGGCMSQEVPYDLQIRWKEKEVLEMMEAGGLIPVRYHGIHSSPEQYHYRNKMEYTFGDETKGAPLSLGLHYLSRKNSIITVDQCQLVSEDFNRLLRATLDHFSAAGIPYYWPMSHQGTLRNLIIREGKRTGELMAILVTATDPELDPLAWANELLQTDLSGKLTSIWHMTNDSLQDAVVADRLDLLYGEPYIHEIVCGLNFRISPQSFFQTNTEAAERMYRQVLEFAGDLAVKDVFDLYCGTGTIGNILAPYAKHVTGVEIIEEAVQMAQENAKINGNDNATFLAGDVKDVIATLTKAPDLIVVDPPRGGIHPKALQYLLEFKAEQIIYVSCNPKTMVQDVMKMTDYAIHDLVLMDNYPNTNHVETIVLITRENT